MTNKLLDELIVPAPPYRMARPVATLAAAGDTPTTPPAEQLPPVEAEPLPPVEAEPIVEPSPEEAIMLEAGKAVTGAQNEIQGANDLIAEVGPLAEGNEEALAAVNELQAETDALGAETNGLEQLLERPTEQAVESGPAPAAEGTAAEPEALTAEPMTAEQEAASIAAGETSHEGVVTEPAVTEAPVATEEVPALTPEATIPPAPSTENEPPVISEVGTPALEGIEPPPASPAEAPVVTQPEKASPAEIAEQRAAAEAVTRQQNFDQKSPAEQKKQVSRDQTAAIKEDAAREQRMQEAAQQHQAAVEAFEARPDAVTRRAVEEAEKNPAYVAYERQKSAAEERFPGLTKVAEKEERKEKALAGPQEEAQAMDKIETAHTEALKQDKVEEAHAEGLKEQSERMIPKPDRLGFFGTIAEAARSAWEHSSAKAWKETFWKRTEAMLNRNIGLWNGVFQQRVQGKLDTAKDKIKELEDQMADAGPIKKLWYGNRLRAWQKRAAGLETKVDAWDNNRMRFVERHNDLLQEVASRYDRELKPFRELMSDVGARLEVHQQARDHLVKQRDEAIAQLAQAEIAGKKGRWFMGPAARSAVNKIKQQIAEMDGRISAADNVSNGLRQELANAKTGVDKWELKKKVVAQQTQLPEMKGVKRPDRGPEVAMRTPMRIVGEAARREATIAARAEKNPAEKESKPEDRVWQLADFMNQWKLNGLQPIEDPKSFESYVTQERTRLRQKGDPTAKQVVELLVPYITKSSTPKVSDSQLKRDVNFFYANAKPKPRP